MSTLIKVQVGLENPDRDIIKQTIRNMGYEVVEDNGRAIVIAKGGERIVLRVEEGRLTAEILNTSVIGDEIKLLEKRLETFTRELTAEYTRLAMTEALTELGFMFTEEKTEDNIIIIGEKW